MRAPVGRNAAGTGTQTEGRQQNADANFRKTEPSEGFAQTVRTKLVRQAYAQVADANFLKDATCLMQVINHDDQVREQDHPPLVHPRP